MKIKFGINKTEINFIDVKLRQKIMNNFELIKFHTIVGITHYMSEKCF
jgi:hypothetical protein